MVDTRCYKCAWTERLAGMAPGPLAAMKHIKACPKGGKTA